MTVTDFTNAIVSGIVSGFISSGIFFLFLRRFKQQLRISESIALDAGAEGKQKHEIKLVNRTRRRIVEIQAQFRDVQATEALIEGFGVSSGKAGRV